MMSSAVRGTPNSLLIEITSSDVGKRSFLPAAFKLVQFTSYSISTQILIY